MEIEITDALKRFDLVFIDVRSPGEFAEASIPGAVNIPLFDDRQHHQLGIIYHQLGESEARRAALEMISLKLPGLVEQIAIRCGEKIPLIYCQRGGLRSLSLYQILNLTGITALRLKQGYKAFRRYVNSRLGSYEIKPDLFILHGLTGVGKTAVIKELEQSGIPIVVLEGLAGHRGSVFGHIGFTGQPSQKDFDALLLQQLDRHKDETCLVIEGEGRRIGNIYLPLFLSKAMEEGHQLLLTAPIEIRVKHIVETYRPSALNAKEFAELKTALYSLSDRMGSRKVESLIMALEQEKYTEVAQKLCTDYYDRLYSDSRPECSEFDNIIDATDIKNATRQIGELIGRTKMVSAASLNK